jgi:hypothetical protein
MPSASSSSAVLAVPVTLIKLSYPLASYIEPKLLILTFHRCHSLTTNSVHFLKFEEHYFFIANTVSIQVSIPTQPFLQIALGALSR